MPKHMLSFIELHNQLFMQGSNLGNKINAKQRDAVLVQDDERGVVWIYFKQRLSYIPLSNVASADMVKMPDDVHEFLQLADGVQTTLAPPAIARARRGAKPVEPTAPPPAALPPYDPNDPAEVAAHRARVRAASANSNKPDTAVAQNDYLIQEARNQAMGLKHPTTSKAQVQNAQQVGQSASVTGKPKALSHAQLKVQVAQEAKE